MPGKHYTSDRLEGSGIYMIRIGRYFYIGQSTNMRARCRGHFGSLRRGDHKNPKMQSVFRKYGNPSFHAICKCSKEKLDLVEQAFLDKYSKDKNCMNIGRFVGETNRGRVFSKQHRERIGIASRKKTMSAEARAKVSAAQKGRKRSQSTKDKIARSRIGGKNPMSKPIWVHDIDASRRFDSIPDAAKWYGVKYNTFKAWVYKGRGPLSEPQGRYRPNGFQEYSHLRFTTP